MPQAHLQLKIDPELRDALDTFAAEQGYTRSHAARHLLEIALGQPQELAAAKQVMWTVLKRFQRNKEAIAKDLQEVFLQYVSDAITSDEGEHTNARNSVRSKRPRR